MQKLKAILKEICKACDQAETDEFEYASEWLGYLPYGVYHWVDVGDVKGIESKFPSDWEHSDLEKLVAEGCLEVLEVSEGRFEPDDLLIRYRLTSSGRKRIG